MLLQDIQLSNNSHSASVLGEIALPSTGLISWHNLIVVLQYALSILGTYPNLGQVLLNFLPI